MSNIALVVGATGISGGNLAATLISNGWETYGLSRNPQNSLPELKPVAANLLDVDSLKEALKDINPTHVFFTTWMRNDTEKENIRVNSALVRNLLAVLSPKKCVKHVGLVTGLKHYLGPFEAYANSGTLPQTPLREEQPRLDLDNFYYAQEDEVYAAAERDGFTWSVHRPHTLIGKAVGNAMNMGTTLAVYATICKELNKPFVWPGSEAQWNGLSDVTDVNMLSEQILWAATNIEAHNKAYNIANGDVFRWNWLWEQIAAYFDVPFEGYNGAMRPLELEMSGYNEIWKEIAQRGNLAVDSLERITSAWHTDLDLGRPLEVVTDMEASRTLGFTTFKSTRASFFELFDQLQKDNIIPKVR